MPSNPYRYDSELEDDVVLTIPSATERARRLQARALRVLGGLTVAAISGWLAWGIVRALDESPELPAPPHTAYSAHAAHASGAAAAVIAPADPAPATAGGLQLRLSERLSPR